MSLWSPVLPASVFAFPVQVGNFHPLYHYNKATIAPKTTPAKEVASRTFKLEAAPVKVAGATPTEVATVWTGGAATDVAAGGGGAPPPKLKDPLADCGGGGGGAVAAGGGGGAVVPAGGGGGILTWGSLAAFSMYFSMVLGPVGAWLMTMAIPFWQWLT